jgi:predicted hotdog family 3-hydroxylacyl-ACP dehydratase
VILNKTQIAAMIPHGPSMCLLDEVVSWDSSSIHCRSNTFATVQNPLFENDHLDTVLLVEYAAQSAAIHASLCQSSLGTQRPAYIGAVKDVELLARISENFSSLEIHMNCLLQSDKGAIYEMLVLQNIQPLIRGRLILNQP